MSVDLKVGDCREVMAAMERESVHAIVTDPPYHFTSIVKRFGKPGSAPAKAGATGAYKRHSTGFMGQTWDGGDIAFQPATWRACLDVLKPGGHLITFGGTRTFHRLACAIEDAGFEIRDTVMWLYGSGFPKSHDVSKGIDRAGGLNTREQSALLRNRREAVGMSREDVAVAIGCTESSIRDWEEGRARAAGGPIEYIVPSESYRHELARLLGYSTDERRLIGCAVDRRGDDSVIGLGHSGAIKSGGNTDAAREWAGWGTALKPAWEPIIVARKPLDGTVANNVQAHGTGALNIDGCRVEIDAEDDIHAKNPHTVGTIGAKGIYGAGEPTLYDVPKGRWPANVIHDGSDEVMAAFAVSGESKSVGGRIGKAAQATVTNVPAGEYKAGDPGFGDTGTAARFFYCAKASSEERNGSKHPTVKPLALMRYLVRLVTPPGGLVLDPFAGSGTTGVAAKLEGFHAVLIELEAEYAADINRRLGALSGADTPLFVGAA